MGEYIENVNEISDESLNEVAGGKKQPVGPGMGIQWDDPRCLGAVRWCGNFKERFKDCDLFSPSDKEKMYSYCDQFCFYMSETAFDLNMAKTIFIGMTAILTYNSMTPAARGAWGGFATIFNSIFE